MDRAERLALVASAFVMAGFFVAMVYAATGLGIGVPTCVTDVAPFSEGKIIDKGGNHYEVHVVAKMWSFDPAEINLPPGADVDLYLSAKDVMHGLYIERTDVNLMAIPGSVNAARVTFRQPGTYAMVCHEYCGTGHQNMAGRFVIGALPPAALRPPWPCRTRSRKRGSISPVPAIRISPAWNGSRSRWRSRRPWCSTRSASPLRCATTSSCR